MKIVILYSGGLDSLIMKQYAEVTHPGAEIKCVYYAIGQPYMHKELNAISLQVLDRDIDIKHLDWLDEETGLFSKENTQNIMIPGRNMALAVLAACQYLPDQIWMGAVAGETHVEATDKNYLFLDYLNDLLHYVLEPYGKTPTVKFPLADEGWGKFEAVEWFLENGGTQLQCIESSSCLSALQTDTIKNCGQCIVCLRRWGIFNQLGFTEDYLYHPVADMSAENTKMVCEMIKGELGQACHYDEYRRREIMPALYDYVRNGK